MNSRRILLVDDDHDHLLLCTLVFEKRGFTVLALQGCDPWETFIEKVRSFHPHVILMDNQMPVICGPEAITRLKTEQDLVDIKLILFSSNANIDQLAKEAGADSFIQKPFGINSLLFTIDTFMEDSENLSSVIE